MIRGVGLRGAVAVNVITMIGIGPLITIPLVLAQLHGSAALWAWVVGAAIALCDGLVYAELASLYPGSGSTYVFLREAFGPTGVGRALAFLFAWQFVISAPLLIATGYIGFAQYAAYLWPRLATDALLQHVVAAAVGLVTLVALYRPVRLASAIGIVLAGVACATLGALVVAALAHGNLARGLDADAHAPLGAALLAGLGPALVITLYDYAGYGQACTIGDEIREPARTLPLAIVISIGLVGVLYIATQIGVLAVVPWRELVPASPGGATPAIANYVGSVVVERVWGTWPARVATILVLVTAFASTYGNLLGASRVPYAAALDGVFFRVFGRLHARDRFPTVALVVLGLIALPACFFSLNDVINALTAGIVIVQSIAQIAALAVLRARGTRAPYRMWLYPVPALLAFAGWAYIFVSSGSKAIAYGLGSLALGIVVYAIRARLAADWPFLAKVAKTSALIALVVVALGSTPPRPVGAATWGHAAIVERDGTSVFEVDGSPFFVYGAAFFYERLPRDEWRDSMLRLKALGINTLDLYVPWNWHELADDDFDFSGRTNPRRDFDEVLRLARELDFKLIVRPGPVIRNEWRNGGYPAWLLSRPEYGMPAHDLLEGRYPPTATLQNAHSDDAAAEWMANATHMTYAKRWLSRVLHECEPDADRILAIALDDDQGAYIDNQTYPAPHFMAYIDWLRNTVHAVTGPSEPTFINTYQMKVTSSSPVWAMGNWYQSEAYAIGEHDRAQLEFSTGLLHTRPGQPMMSSEFQAGWLEQPDEVRPRATDPSNTALALGTMIGMGVRGVVNFPAQDTLDPMGWEAPFANGFYAWDAALELDGSAAARAAPTAAFGALVARYGRELAGARVRYDAAIAYLGGSIATERATNDYFAGVETQTIAMQRGCRDAGLTCALVDPRAIAARDLARYPLLIVAFPTGFSASDETPDVRATLAAYVARGGTIASDASAAAIGRAYAATGRRRAVEGVRDATFAEDATGRLDGFLTVTNYDDVDRVVASASVRLANGRRIVLPRFTVPRHFAIVAPVGVRFASYGVPHVAADDGIAFTDCMEPPPPGDKHLTVQYSTDLVVFPGPPGIAGTPASTDLTPNCRTTLRIRGNETTLGGPAAQLAAAATTGAFPNVPDGPGVPIRNDARLPNATFDTVVPGTARAYLADVFRDGSQDVVFDNGLVRVVVAPDAGARAFVFEDDATGRNAFTSIGAMRDDVAVEPPLSTTDRIAKYTHQFPAGMFDRSYRTTLASGSAADASATFAYDAPDVLPMGAGFTRTVSLAPNARAVVMAERVDLHGAPSSDAQRAVSVTSLAVGDGPSTGTRRVFAPDAAPFVAASTIRVATGHALGFYDAATNELATIAWRAGGVDDAVIREGREAIVVRLTLARDRTARVRYGYETAIGDVAARAAVAAADLAAQVP